MSTKWGEEWSILSAGMLDEGRDSFSLAFPSAIPLPTRQRKDKEMWGKNYLDEKVKQPVSIAMTMAVTALLVAMVALAVALGGPK